MYYRQFPMILRRAARAKERLERSLFLQSKVFTLKYAPTFEHLNFSEKSRLNYRSICEGEEWGCSQNLQWASAWFAAEVDLRDELPDWRLQQRQWDAELALYLDFNGEALVFAANGEIIQGLSGGSVFAANFQRALVRRADELLQDAQLHIWIEAAAYNLFGLQRDDDPQLVSKASSGENYQDNPQKDVSPNVAKNIKYYGRHVGRVQSARVVLFDKILWQYLLDLDAAAQLAKSLLGAKHKTSSPRAKRLLYAIDSSLSRHAMQRARLPEAHKLLRQTLYNGNAPSDLQTVAVGHAHIDTAWLWPLDETVRKCARTFANQLRLLRHYPNFIFGASQPQHYQFIKDKYPELYGKIKHYVAEGRWELQGAMWVEADANIPSGESLVRQILHGKNFFRDEFGVEVRNLWLPDVFGYSANLPQILRRSGVEYFLTQKLSWSQYNDFPHHTFYWHGIDDSAVLTHFPPENTYNSAVTLANDDGSGLLKAQKNFKEAHILSQFMTLYGMGDGGGGPDETMLERALALGAAGGDGAENTPRVKFGCAADFFTQLSLRLGGRTPKKNLEKNPEENLEGNSGEYHVEYFGEQACDLPHWKGELYLELHRGTLSSQAYTKRANRQLEQELHAIEYVYSLETNREINHEYLQKEYPQKELDKLWKMLLTNQFHDIIPGSSIHEVYCRARREHAEGLATCARLLAEWEHRQPSRPHSVTLLNPYSLPLQLVVALPQDWSGAASQNEQNNAEDNRQISGQISGKVLSSERDRALVKLPPQAIITLQNGGPRLCEAPVTARAQDGMLVLENTLVRYTFTLQGQLCGVWDKKMAREFLAVAGEQFWGNRLRLYQDWPHNWDAWDIDINYRAEMLAELLAERAEILPTYKGSKLVQGLYFAYRCGSASFVEQTVTLEAGSRRLNFANSVDWHERHRMLRVSFAPQIYSNKASYDIQYGYLERATHRNTSWEMAQFEVLGQRYADLSDHDCGWTLLNDSKYGHRIEGNCLDLNLLRAATLPDPDADQSHIVGPQQFSYAILLHEGNLQKAMPEVQAEAALFNRGPLRFVDIDLASLILPVVVESENVTLEVLKKAEKSNSLVLRLVERAGSESRVKIKFSGELVECDLLEWREFGATHHGTCELIFSPFALRTFLLRRGGRPLVI